MQKWKFWEILNILGKTAGLLDFCTLHEIEPTGWN